MHDPELIELITRQSGLITFRQAREAGLTPGTIRQRYESGAWVRLHGGIFRHVLVPRSWRTDVTLGILATGGLASHHSAARLHRFPEVAPRPAEVVVAHGRWKPVDRVIVHQSTQIDRADETVVDGLACTGAGRTLLDLGASMSPRRLGKVVDALLRERRVTQGELWDVLIRHSVQGRNGCGPLRAVLDERRGEKRIALSDWSYAVANLLEAAGLPRPELEFRAHDAGGRFLAQIDLAYPTALLAIELDSVAYHHDLESFHRDRRRARQLTTNGWSVLQFTWQDYADRPSELIAQVRRILMPPVAA